MKRFRSKYEVVRKLAHQRKQLAELEVMCARQAEAQVEHQREQVRQSQADEADTMIASLSHPQLVHTLLASRVSLKIQQEQLLALDGQSQQARAKLLEATTEWRLRTTAHDQAAQLIENERHTYREDNQRAEQLELEETARQAGPNHRVEGISQ